VTFQRQKSVGRPQFNLIQQFGPGSAAGLFVAHRLQHEDAGLEWMEGPTLNTKLVIGRSSWIAPMLVILALRAVPAGATPFAFDQTYYFNDSYSENGFEQPLLPDSVGSATHSIDVAITTVGPDQNGSPFSLDVSAHSLPQLDLGNFSQLNCLEYSGPGCVEYVVVPTGVYSGPIQITIAWSLNTNGTTTSPIIIQAEGSDPYSSELQNQTYFPCGLRGCIDPADTGTTDNFSRFAEADNPVPEPSALMLLGSGLLSLGYRARRRFSR
jgi:hypothetical protein